MTTRSPLPGIVLPVLILAALTLGSLPACADAPATLLDLRTSRQLALADALPVLAGADLVLVGESHGDMRHHAAQPITHPLHGAISLHR